jgi:hypothetical protein
MKDHMAKMQKLKSEAMHAVDHAAKANELVKAMGGMKSDGDGKMMMQTAKQHLPPKGGYKAGKKYHG